MEANLDDTKVAELGRDHARKRLSFEPDDARQAKVARPTIQYFQQYNFDERGASIDECSMHALNSTLVNCLDREPIQKWSVSGIPQKVITGHRKLKSGKTRKIETNRFNTPFA